MPLRHSPIFFMLFKRKLSLQKHLPEDFIFLPYLPKDSSQPQPTAPMLA